jgi:hypothetical protein
MYLKYPCNLWKPFKFIEYENVAIKQTQFDEIKWFVFFFTFLVIIVPYANMTNLKKLSFLLHNLLYINVIFIFGFYLLL